MPKRGVVVGQGLFVYEMGHNGGPTQTSRPPYGSAAINAIPANACVAAAGQRGVSRPQSGACDIGALELVDPFPDVAADHNFAEEIFWLNETGITGGYEDGTFRPTAPVSRQAMAAFLYRAMGSPDFTSPATPTFLDVPTTHPFYDEIEWLVSTEITTGHDDNSFRPTASVSRQAMAAFLYRYNSET